MYCNISKLLIFVFFEIQFLDGAMLGAAISRDGANVVHLWFLKHATNRNTTVIKLMLFIFGFWQPTTKTCLHFRNFDSVVHIDLKVLETRIMPITVPIYIVSLQCKFPKVHAHFIKDNWQLTPQQFAHDNDLNFCNWQSMVMVTSWCLFHIRHYFPENDFGALFWFQTVSEKNQIVMKSHCSQITYNEIIIVNDF